MTALEDLQHLEQEWHHVLDLLTQAEVALEQVHVMAGQLQPSHADPHQLMETIHYVRYELHSVTDHHNELLAQLQEAQRQEHEGQANQQP